MPRPRVRPCLGQGPITVNHFHQFFSFHSPSCPSCLLGGRVQKLQNAYRVTYHAVERTRTAMQLCRTCLLLLRLLILGHANMPEVLDSSHTAVTLPGGGALAGDMPPYIYTSRNVPETTGNYQCNDDKESLLVPGCQQTESPAPTFPDPAYNVSWYSLTTT